MAGPAVAGAGGTLSCSSGLASKGAVSCDGGRLRSTGGSSSKLRRGSGHTVAAPLRLRLMLRLLVGLVCLLRLLVGLVCLLLPLLLALLLVRL